MLPDYNAQTIMLQANQAAGFFDESYHFFSIFRNRHASFLYFLCGRHLKIKRRDYLLMLDIVIPKTCKKSTINGRSLHHSLLPRGIWIFLLLPSWNFRLLDKHQHYFWQTDKGIWKELKTLIIVAVSIIVIMIAIFIIVSMLYIQTELMN